MGCETRLSFINHIFRRCGFPIVIMYDVCTYVNSCAQILLLKITIKDDLISVPTILPTELDAEKDSMKVIF